MKPISRLPALPSTLALGATIALGATLAACGGSIRVVNQAPTHGELALLGNRHEARDLARSHMERHCPEGYRVLNDGKIHVSAPHQDIGASEGRAGVKGTDPDKVRWHIRYRCEGENGEVSPIQ